MSEWWLRLQGEQSLEQSDIDALRWTPLFGPKNAEIKLVFQVLRD
jgi:hypothetical protein